jgi:hypothetical protein
MRPPQRGLDAVRPHLRQAPRSKGRRPCRNGAGAPFGFDGGARRCRTRVNRGQADEERSSAGGTRHQCKLMRHGCRSGSTRKHHGQTAAEGKGRGPASASTPLAMLGPSGLCVAPRRQGGRLRRGFDPAAAPGKRLTMIGRDKPPNHGLIATKSSMSTCGHVDLSACNSTVITGRGGRPSLDSHREHMRNIPG